MVNLNRCTLCQPINVNDIVARGLILPLNPYLLAWQKGSDSHPQCGLCKLVSRCMYVHMLQDDQSAILLFKYNSDHKIIVVIATTVHFATTSIYLELLCGPTAEQWSYDSKSRFSCAFLRMNVGVGDFKGSVTSRRLLSTNPGSNVCLDVAKRWLTECSKHAETHTTFVPSRLIDLRPSSEDDIAALVSMGQHDGGNGSCPIKYAALSYCWGADRFLTTTSLNIDAMMQSISISQLPRTIQDAIKIVRHLGIRYFWVDSLCIIQGTDAVAQRDWLSESEMMGHIYQSAHFTISAESASTALAGILNDRTKPSVDICAIPISAESSDMIYLTQHQFLEPEITEPLHLRGWTLQETIMSQRLLRFGTRELSWRCPHGIQTESRGEARETSPCDKSEHKEPIEELSEQTHDIYTGWQTMIENYSRRAITVKSDKLHAIAGLAAIAQSNTDDVYAAGIWARGAPLNLLWMHARHKSVYSRKEEFQAPTWSWASVEGPIQFLQAYKRIDDITVEWKPCDDHAAADFHKRHGLSITGRMVQLDSIRCHQFGSYYGGYDGYLPWAWVSENVKTYVDDLDDIPSINKKGGGENPAELVNSWFLLLAKLPGFGVDHFGAGLILLPAGSRQKCFRRVGMFEGFPLKDFYELERNSRPVLKSLFQRTKSPTTTVRLV